MQAQEADRAATRVGLVTVLIGAALAIAPQRMSRVLRFGDHARAVQVVGLADMALVPGLVFAQRKGNWMAARAALNLLIAAYLPHPSRPQGRSPGTEDWSRRHAHRDHHRRARHLDAARSQAQLLGHSTLSSLAKSPRLDSRESMPHPPGAVAFFDSFRGNQVLLYRDLRG